MRMNLATKAEYQFSAKYNKVYNVLNVEYCNIMINARKQEY